MILDVGNQIPIHLPPISRATNSEMKNYLHD
jgi:hypothetical protein